MAAKALDLGIVWIDEVRYKNEHEARDATISRQIGRRNMSRGQAAIFAVRNAPEYPDLDADALAEKFLVSAITIHRARGILEFPDLVEAVLTEERSLLDAYADAPHAEAAGERR
jgi:hypothetical protein